MGKLSARNCIQHMWELNIQGFAAKDLFIIYMCERNAAQQVRVGWWGFRHGPAFHASLTQGEHPHCTWHFGSEGWVARGRRAHPAPRSQDNKHMKLAKFFKPFPFVNSVVDQNHARITAESRMILSTRLNHGARTVY